MPRNVSVPTTLMAKLGSALVHAFEHDSPDGTSEDRGAFLALINDPDVCSWLRMMHRQALIPTMRVKEAAPWR